MKGSCLNEEYIPLMDRHLIADIQQCIILNALPELLLADFMLKTIQQAGPRLTIHYVPHFRLAVFALNTQCIVVIGMNLHRQIALGINELYEQGKIGERCRFASQHIMSLFFLAVQPLFKRLPLRLTIGNYAHTGFMTGKLPAFRYLIQLRVLAILVFQTGAAP